MLLAAKRKRNSAYSPWTGNHPQPVWAEGFFRGEGEGFSRGEGEGFSRGEGEGLFLGARARGFF